MERYGLREALLAIDNDEDIIQESESDDDYRNVSPTIGIQQAIVAQPIVLFNDIHSDELGSEISVQENFNDNDLYGGNRVGSASPTVEIQEAVVAQPFVLLNDLQSVNSHERFIQEIPIGNDDVISIDSSSSGHSASTSVSREPTPEVDVKRENTESEQSEVISKKRARSESDIEEDGQICPICLDNWTNSGEHRICSLKCGHLFGHCCILRWLQMQTKRSCPTCKKKVMKTDIRFIYAKKLIAVDTSELDEIKQKLDNVIDERNKMQLELSKYICREHSLHQEVNKLKTQLTTFRNNPMLFSASSTRTDNNLNIKVRLYMDKSLDICQMGGCRVFDANPELDFIMANAKSPNTLFSNYGLRKISISQYKPLAFLPLHSGQIRDISFQNAKVLTVSVDKSFKITDSASHTNVCSLSQRMPLWSCCWDSLDSNYFYIGTQIGSVFKYDQRNLGSSLSNLAVTGDMSPVVSVAHIPNEPGSLPRDGIVSCKLNSLWFFENNADYVSHPLSVDGPFYSMKFDSLSKQLLVSSRPNNRNPNSRHTLAVLKSEEGKVNTNCVHIFESAGLQKHLSRSCFIQGENEYIAAHEESSKMVNLWNINNGMKVTSVAAHEPVLDLNAVSQCGNTFLIGLTEKKMLFYKFV